MKLRFALLAIATMFVATGARAQGGLYFNPIVTVVHNSTPDTGPFAFLGEGQTQQVFGGVMFGGYYEVYHAPKFNFSIDLRDEVQHGNSALLNRFDFSPRVTYVPSDSKLRPYAQIGIGAGRTHSKLNPISTTKLDVLYVVGVDRAISHIVDWRIVEVGYGSLQTASSSSIGGNSPAIPNASTYQFSTGLVFRLP